MTPAQKAEYERIKSLHSFPLLPPEMTEVVLSVSVEIKNDAEAARKRLEELINTHLEMFSYMVSLSTEGNKLLIGVAVPFLSQAFNQSQLAPFQSTIDTL